MSSAFTGPTLQGVTFELKSGNPGKPNHVLTIALQQPLDASIAFIAGTWQGDGNAKNVSGSITSNPVRITCSWPNGKTGMNALVGHVDPASRVPGNPTGRWRLSGSVVVTDGQGNVVPGAGPGAVSGGEPPLTIHP